MKHRTPKSLEVAFQRRYQDDPQRSLVLLMQRFVARVCQHLDGAVVKGGLGLELRLDTPRTTKDADIIIAGAHHLDTRLTAAGMLDLGDFLKFKVFPDKDDATFTVPGMQYHAKRYLVRAYFASHDPPPSQSPFRKFTVEVSIQGAPAFDQIPTRWQEFVQVPDVMIRVYALHWQIAEKVHAYTDPRHRDATNRDRMRPRDLMDLCRCAVSSQVKIESEPLRGALEQTFQKRKAAEPTLQDLPVRLPEMPLTWEAAFLEQVKQANLPWTTPAKAHAVAARFLDPVLGSTAIGAWHPVSGWG